MIRTSLEMMARGLELVGFDERRQQSVRYDENLERFKSYYGSKPIVYAHIWEDLQTSDIAEARICRRLKCISGETSFAFSSTHTSEIALTTFGNRYVKRRTMLLEIALPHDRGIYPKPPLNHRGEPQWEGSAAERLLWEDLKQRNENDISSQSSSGFREMSTRTITKTLFDSTLSRSPG